VYHTGLALSFSPRPFSSFKTHITPHIYIYIYNIHHHIHIYPDFGITGYISCMEVRFLSLEQTPVYCREVLDAIDDKYIFDDKGYWNTDKKWSFAESMCGGHFLDFQTTDTNWLDYSKDFFEVPPIYYQQLSTLKKKIKTFFFSSFSLSLNPCREI
jgi:hypothetical protein